MSDREGPRRPGRRHHDGNRAGAVAPKSAAAPKSAGAPKSVGAQKSTGAAARRHVAHQAFRRAHVTVALAWVSGTAGLVFATRFIDPGVLPPVVALGTASGILAHLGLLPGTLLSRRRVSDESPLASPEEADSGGDDGMVGWLAGALIRVFGTVAIFGLARYQMADADRDGWILGTVLGFYAGLTALEVWVLARVLPTADGPGVDSSPADPAD